MSCGASAINCRVVWAEVLPDARSASPSTVTTIVRRAAVMVRSLSGHSLLVEPGSNVPGARLQGLAGTPLELAEVFEHGWPRRGFVRGQPREAVERPGADERLRERDVLGQDRSRPSQLSGTPLEERQRPHDLKANLPFVAARERP